MIKKVAKNPKKIKANGAEVIDGAGATLMPGLIEPHAHVCYVDGVALPEIGRKFGGRDHTTVMHAIRKVDELRDLDQGFGEDVELLRRMLEN